MKEYEMCIKVDTNDADYNIAITKITQEVLDKIKPLIKAIKKKTKEHSKELGHYCNYPFNYPFGEDTDDDPQRMYPDIDEEVFELFQDYCPYSEFGFHTVEMVVVYPLPIPDKERLL